MSTLSFESEIDVNAVVTDFSSTQTAEMAPQNETPDTQHEEEQKYQEDQATKRKMDDTDGASKAKRVKTDEEKEAQKKKAADKKEVQDKMCNKLYDYLVRAFTSAYKKGSESMGSSVEHNVEALKLFLDRAVLGKEKKPLKDDVKMLENFMISNCGVYVAGLKETLGKMNTKFASDMPVMAKLGEMACGLANTVDTVEAQRSCYVVKMDDKMPADDCILIEVYIFLKLFHNYPMDVIQQKVCRVLSTKRRAEHYQTTKMFFMNNLTSAHSVQGMIKNCDGNQLIIIYPEYFQGFNGLKPGGYVTTCLKMMVKGDEIHNASNAKESREPLPIPTSLTENLSNTVNIVAVKGVHEDTFEGYKKSVEKQLADINVSLERLKKNTNPTQKKSKSMKVRVPEARAKGFLAQSGGECDSELTISEDSESDCD